MTSSSVNVRSPVTAAATADDIEDAGATPSRLTFAHLPPELRHEIWRLAVPSPGINFFNVHCFPNDHQTCNRSTSPPWAYLDLRRMSIEHDDCQVSRYDPSSWQARYALRQTCHEARVICALPESSAASITLTRPKRGLFVRAGDGQLRNTPLQEFNHAMPMTEPVVRRTIQVHLDDILCLSVENCSFSLPHEEAPSFSSSASFNDADSQTSGDLENGWSYDPQITPPLPQAISPTRLCASIAMRSINSLHVTADALFGLLYSHIPGYIEPHGEVVWAGPLLVMLDDTQATHNYRLEGPTSVPDGPSSAPKMVWDRFGDCYVWLPGHISLFASPQRFPTLYALLKLPPEINSVQHRYRKFAPLYWSNPLLTAHDSGLPSRMS
ncbi:hypothetical protein GGS21DRAFT_367585 [Xylaria nigripes]|nr:hypothetical protein GGS21DRAFT_367585 [Xylaria nigripes]